MMSTGDGTDVLTQVLIAQLLEEESKDMASACFAESLQLAETLQDTDVKGKRLMASMPPDLVKAVEMNDSDLTYALQLIAEDARFSSDAAYAAKLQLDNDANFMVGYQYAQQVAAAEKKILLDAEFARKLQDTHDSGIKDLDDISMKDADGVLGKDVLDQILASDPNSKGKDKGKAPSYEKMSEPQGHTIPCSPEPSPSPYDTCGICLEPFQPTYSPSAAAQSANSSTRVQFGLRLPCPAEHGYCITCMQAYIKSKLDPDDEGTGSSESIVFPIPCPECDTVDWPNGIQDAVAERVLDSDKMITLWHYQRLLDSIPHYYCPNPKCSIRVEVGDDQEDPQAECPACNSLLCVPCRSLWHDNMSCDTYQALPLEDRSPDDLLTLQIVQAENWRRCPQCSYIVELAMGCNHVTCRCKTEFCFKCGSLWDKRRGRCTSDPACSLWDEDMLLEDRERQRQHAIPQAARAAPRAIRQVPALGAFARPAPEPVPPPPYNPQPVQNVPVAELEWINNPNILCNRHLFTVSTVRQLQCQYCTTAVESLRGLQMHLSLARHPLYACCGRLFRNEDNFSKHITANTRFGHHVHRVRRD